MANARLVNSTIDDYIRKETVNILRKRVLMAALQEKGRISYDGEGLNMNWKVRFKRAPMSTFNYGTTQTFVARDKRRTASLPMRGYYVNDQITAWEQAQNQGTAAIIKLVSTVATELMDDIRDGFSRKIYASDGGATGSQEIHGFESFCAFTDGGYAGGFISAPTDTYAGLSCTLGAYGGAWSGTTWPLGSGDEYYDFWTPVLVDYTDTGWTAGTDTWANTCLESLRFGITYGQRNGEKLDLIIMDQDMFRQLKDAVATKERANFQVGGSAGLLTKLGYGDSIVYDGVEITSEFGLPRGTESQTGLTANSPVAYGISFDSVELKSWKKQLFNLDKDFDITGLNQRFSIHFFGNMRCNPRNFVKWHSDT